MLFGGCTAAHYRQSADKEVYGIIQNMEKRIFGTTNDFSIDTGYSRRDYRTILPAEIIRDRTATNCRIINLVMNGAPKTIFIFGFSTRLCLKVW